MIPAQGPCTLEDAVGMSVAVDMLYGSLVSVPRLQGESHIQFELMRCIRATITKSWILLPQGIAEGGSFSYLLWENNSDRLTYRARMVPPVFSGDAR
jgi:hypothetical protein